MIKEKKCKNCKDYFKPRFSTLEKYCWKEDCKYIDAMEKLEQKKKNESKEWKKRKSKMKTDLMTLKDYIIIAQEIFNKWIRQRDKGLNCISCDKPIKEGNCDAGHMWSAFGHANLRFNEFNVNSQCSRPCNKDKSGDSNNYRIGFIKKYGAEKLAELDAIAHVERKFTKEEVQEIINEYKKRLKNI